MIIFFLKKVEIKWEKIENVNPYKKIWLFIKASFDQIKSVFYLTNL